MKQLLTIFLMIMMIPFLSMGQGEHPIDYVRGVKYPGATIEATRYGYKFVHPDSSVTPHTVRTIVDDSVGRFIQYDEDSAYFSTGLSNGKMTGSTYFGLNAGGGDTALYNSAFGWEAGLGKGGLGETTFGARAGKSNTGAELTAVGYYAALNNTAFALTAVGYTAGRNNSGIESVAVGNFSLYGNTGSGAVGVGYKSLANGTSENTTAVGYFAGLNSTGDNNSYFGYDVGNGVSFSDVHLFGYDIAPDQANQVKLGSATVARFTVRNLNIDVSTVPTTSEFLRYNGSEYVPVELNISGAGNPSGVTTPEFEGQIYRDTGTNTIYYSIGVTNTDWVALN